MARSPITSSSRLPQTEGSADFSLLFSSIQKWFDIKQKQNLFFRILFFYPLQKPPNTTKSHLTAAPFHSASLLVLITFTTEVCLPFICFLSIASHRINTTLVIYSENWMVLLFYCGRWRWLLLLFLLLLFACLMPRRATVAFLPLHQTNADFLHEGVCSRSYSIVCNL